MNKCLTEITKNLINAAAFNRIDTVFYSFIIFHMRVDFALWFFKLRINPTRLSFSSEHKRVFPAKYWSGVSKKYQRGKFMFLFWDCDLILKKSCYTKLNAWLIRCSHHHHERNSFTTNFILLSTIGIFTLAPFGKDCLKKGQYLSMKSNILLHKLTTKVSFNCIINNKRKRHSLVFFA